MAVKAKLKITHTGADAKKVASAFHEVYSNVPKNVKATGKTGAAKTKMMTAIALSKARAAGASIPDKSGSNFVSPNDLHIPAGVTGQGTAKWTRGSSRVKPTGQCDAGKNPQSLHDYPTHAQYVADRFPALHMGDAQVQHEIEMEEVKQVGWRKTINPVEQVRQRSNQTRDLRTNLGRGKPAQPTVGESGTTSETR